MNVKITMITLFRAGLQTATFNEKEKLLTEEGCLKVVLIDLIPECTRGNYLILAPLQ